MPRKRTVGLIRRTWTTADVWALKFRQDFLGANLTEEEARYAWLDLRDSILPDWIARKPFTRPSGWWRFDRRREPPETLQEQRQYLISHNLLTPAERKLLT